MAAAGFGSRITLQATPIEAFEDDDGLDLVWMPVIFLSRAILEDAVAHAVAAMRPGAQIVLGRYAGPDDPNHRGYFTAWDPVNNKIVWRLKSCAARDVYEEAGQAFGWAPSTTKTLLRRLVDKGHLTATAVGTSYLYRPARPAWQGYAEADYVKVGPTQQGLLTEVTVARGSRVELGTPLFVQDETADRAARDQAARQLQQARDQLANLESAGKPTEIELEQPEPFGEIWVKRAPASGAD